MNWPPLPLRLSPPSSQANRASVPASAQALPASGRLPWESVSSQSQTLQGPGSPCTRLGRSTGQTASERAPDFHP